jgi:hypothetical protein
VIIAVPAEPPVTTPVVDPTDAVAEALLDQVPPDGVPVNVVVSVPHTTLEPVIGPGFALTVTVCVAAAQPVDKV